VDSRALAISEGVAVAKRLLLILSAGPVQWHLASQQALENKEEAGISILISWQAQPQRHHSLLSLQLEEEINLVPLEVSPRPSRINLHLVRVSLHLGRASLSLEVTSLH